VAANEPLVPGPSPGPSWGRETAVNSGQSRCPADNDIGRSTAVIRRHRPAGPYMACKKSEVHPLWCTRGASNLPATLPRIASRRRCLLSRARLATCGVMVWRLAALGPSSGGRSLHTAEVTGSIPVTPTSTNSPHDLALSGACQKICQKTTFSRRWNALSAARIEGLVQSALTTCLQSQIGRDHQLRRQGTAEVEGVVVLSVQDRS
jgi:hypothetical protein